MATGNSQFASSRHLYTKPGISNVGSYQVSGKPYLTGSLLLPSGTAGPNTGPYPTLAGQSYHIRKVAFPTVTKSVTIVNTNFFTGSKGTASDTNGLNNGVLQVFFGSEDATVSGSDTPQISKGHHVTLRNNGDSITFDVKTQQIYIANLDTTNTGSFQVIAELTHIPREEMYFLTGSGIDSNIEDADWT
mgnify:FL=1|tara:strand:+ start:230 stop:796 length:567 start_codon:yes stop_codon:yes gene_type:complete